MSVHRNGRGTIRSIVLDSQPLWQRTLAFMLRRKGVQVVAVCSSAGELAAAAPLRPQLVVGDPETVVGFAAQLSELRSALPGLAVIVVSSRDDDEWHRELMAAGAAGFIGKHSELEVIETALMTLIDAELPVESQLSDRELQVLELVADGRTNREVATLLWLSDQTVKFHLANVYRKLGVGSRREAVERARSAGIIRTDVRIGGEEDNEDLAPAVLA